MLSTGVFAGDGDEEDGEKENVAAVAAVATTAKLFLSRPLPPQQPPASSTTSSTSFSLPDPSRLRPLPRDLRSWGVPAPISEAYAAKCGVSLLHEWQAAALREASAGNCFVFAAPTSGGKSLVAEVLLVRQLLRARAEAENEAARAAGGGGGGGGNNGGNNGGASSSSFRPRRCRAATPPSRSPSRCCFFFFGFKTLYDVLIAADVNPIVLAPPPSFGIATILWAQPIGRRISPLERP